MGLAVDLWLEYLHYTEGELVPADKLPIADDKLRPMRDLYNSALSNVGLHVQQGSKVWEAFRAMEERQLEALKKKKRPGKEKMFE